MSQTVTFRVLGDEEEPLGYHVLVDNVAWQKRTGIVLWDRPLEKEAYHARQPRGENFGLFIGKGLAAVVSLVRGAPEYWSEAVGDPNATWMCTLAVADGFHEQGAGKAAVERAMEFLRQAGHTAVWLDCKQGFLERFYESLGFELVHRERKFIPHTGAVFDCALFRKSLD